MSILDVAYDALFNKGRKTKDNVQNMYNKVVDTYNEVMTSPEMTYINDTNQRRRLADINLDNRLGPLFENIVREENAVPRTYYWDNNEYTSMPHRGDYYYRLMDAAGKYNEALAKYGNNGWPADDRDVMNPEIKNRYDWHDWMRYQETYRGNEDDVPFAFTWVNNSEKWNKVRADGKYTPQELWFVWVKTWADLLRRMDTLTKLYDTIDKTKKGIWQRWNALKQSGKWDTKEARDYLDQRNELEHQYFETIRQLRRANSDYRNYVSENRY